MTNAPAAKNSPANEGCSRGAESDFRYALATRLRPCAQTKSTSRPPYPGATDLTAFLMRWLGRRALVSEAHATVVAEPAFRLGRRLMADLFASPVVELHARVDDKPPQTFRGRFAWTLDALLQAGDAGCTPISRPAPRWIITSGGSAATAFPSKRSMRGMPGRLPGSMRAMSSAAASRCSSPFGPGRRVMPRNLPAVVEENAACRERLVGVLRIAQAAGDIVHAKALRLIVKGFDERVAPPPASPGFGSSSAEIPSPGKGTRHANA